jgi:hypothetical protein
MSERRKIRLCLAALAACVLVVGWVENLDDYDLQPGPNAPAFVDWRTGEWRQP